MSLEELPMQPIKNGRFIPNRVVEYLLDHGPLNMNDLAIQDFSDSDRAQFAQLIGYSVGGYGNLRYVSDSSYEKAESLMKKTELLNLMSEYLDSLGDEEFLEKHNEVEYGEGPLVSEYLGRVVRFQLGLMWVLFTYLVLKVL